MRKKYDSIHNKSGTEFYSLSAATKTFFPFFVASMYFKYFFSFSIEPRLAECQKSVINYIPFIMPSDMKRISCGIWNFLIRVSLPMRCCFILFSRRCRLTAKGEYNRRLFAYLCLFLFAFNYHVMSWGLGRYSNFCYLTSPRTGLHLHSHWSLFSAWDSSREHYRFCFDSNASRKNWNFHFFIISILAYAGECKIPGESFKIRFNLQQYGTNYFQLFFFSSAFAWELQLWRAAGTGKKIHAQASSQIRKSFKFAQISAAWMHFTRSAVSGEI